MFDAGVDHPHGDWGSGPGPSSVPAEPALASRSARSLPGKPGIHLSSTWLSCASPLSWALLGVQRLLTDWCVKRQVLVGDIELAISSVKDSYRRAISAKVGGITAAVGYALLIPSFGAALPLAIGIGGTVAAISGGISGGAAAIGDAVVQTKISTKFKTDLESVKALFGDIIDQLAEGIASEIEKVIVDASDSESFDRISQRLKAAMEKLRDCRERHAAL